MGPTVRRMSTVPHLCCVIAQAIFALWTIIGGSTLTSAFDSSFQPQPMSSFNFIFARLLGGSAFMFTFTAYQRHQQPDATPPWKILPAPQHTRRVLLFALCGGLVMPHAFLFGLAKTQSPVLAAVCDGPLLPVATSLLALLVGQEKLPVDPQAQIRQLLALVGCVAGAVVVIVSAAPATDDGGIGVSSFDFGLGVAALLLEGVAFAGALVVQKPLLDSYQPTNLPAWQFGIGALGTIGMIVATSGPTGVANVLVELGYSVVGSTNFSLGLAYCVIGNVHTAMELCI